MLHECYGQFMHLHLQQKELDCNITFLVSLVPFEFPQALSLSLQ